MAQRLIEEYLAMAGHADDASGSLFRPVTNNRTKELDRPLDPDSVYHNIVRRVHSLRATAATNALDNKADIALRSRNGLGTRMCRRQALRPAQNPTGRESDIQGEVLKEKSVTQCLPMSDTSVPAWRRLYL